MPKIFVSYSRSSEHAARAIIADLDLLGHTVWFDRDLSGGQAWWDQILAAIRDASLLIVVTDPQSLASTACKREWRYAIELGKPVLPVLAADGVSMNLLPPELARLQFVDYRTPDRSSAIALARALGQVSAPAPLPDPLPTPPEAPVSYLSALAQRAEATGHLDFEAQSALLVDLRGALRDTETRDDARAVLTRLRSRRDLLATIAEQVDELLSGPTAVPSSSSHAKTGGHVESPSGQTADSTASGGEVTIEVRSTRLRSALWFALIFAVVLIAVVLIADMIAGRRATLADIVLIVVFWGPVGGLCGALTGWMVWRDARARLLTAGFALVGYVFVLSLARVNIPEQDFGVIPLLVGAPSGAVIGAAIGALWRRLQRAP